LPFSSNSAFCFSHFSKLDLAFFSNDLASASVFASIVNPTADPLPPGVSGAATEITAVGLSKL